MDLILFSLFVTVFGMVLLAELADKTQLVTFALVAQTGKPIETYLGVLGGLFCVTLIGVLAGSLIAFFVPLVLIQLLAGIVFVILGGYALYRVRVNQNEEETIVTRGQRVWLRAFTLLFLAELGDKTQLIVILVAASTGQLIVVFLAAFFALAFVNGLGVVVGDQARKYLQTKTLGYIAAAAFIIAGILVMISVL